MGCANTVLLPLQSLRTAVFEPLSLRCGAAGVNANPAVLMSMMKHFDVNKDSKVQVKELSDALSNYRWCKLRDREVTHRRMRRVTSAQLATLTPSLLKQLDTTDVDADSGRATLEVQGLSNSDADVLGPYIAESRCLRMLRLPQVGCSGAAAKRLADCIESNILIERFGAVPLERLRQDMYVKLDLSNNNLSDIELLVLFQALEKVPKADAAIGYTLQHTRCNIHAATYTLQHTRCNIHAATYTLQHSRCIRLACVAGSKAAAA